MGQLLATVTHGYAPEPYKLILLGDSLSAMYAENFWNRLVVVSIVTILLPRKQVGSHKSFLALKLREHHCLCMARYHWSASAQESRSSESYNTTYPDLSR